MLAMAGAGEAGPPAPPPVAVVSDLPPAAAWPAATAATLHDQLAAATVGVISQNFEAANNANDNRAADDFVLPPDVLWSITSIDVAGQYLSGANTLDSVTIWFFADSGANTPGGLAYTGTFNPSGADTGNLGIALTPSALLAGQGHYWLSVQVNKNSATGFWLWREHSGAQNHAPSVWQNPGDGYHIPSCTTWQPRAVCFGSTDNPDLAFRLVGSEIPITTRVFLPLIMR